MPRTLLDVPFFENDGDGKRCMQVAAKMALTYFGIDVSIDELDERSGRPANGWTWSVRITRALHVLGAQVTLRTLENGSVFLGSERDLRDAIGDDAYRIVTEEADLISIREAAKYCMEHALTAAPLDVEGLKRALDERSVPLVLIDYNLLIGRLGFHGHMVPLVGYDEYGFFYHESGPKHARPNAHVSFDDFERAWFASGTDRDAVIVSSLR